MFHIDAGPVSGNITLSLGLGRAWHAAGRSEQKHHFSNTIFMISSHKHYNSEVFTIKSCFVPSLLSFPFYHVRQMTCMNGLFSLRAMSLYEQRAKQRPLQRQHFIFPSSLWWLHSLLKARTTLQNVTVT